MNENISKEFSTKTLIFNITIIKLKVKSNNTSHISDGIWYYIELQLLQTQILEETLVLKTQTHRDIDICLSWRPITFLFNSIHFEVAFF
jgi:hypothetical protein